MSIDRFHELWIGAVSLLTISLLKGTLMDDSLLQGPVGGQIVTLLAGSLHG